MSARVLVVGRHENLMDRVVAILKRHGFEALACLEDESALRAIAAVTKEPLDVVLLGSVIEPASRTKLLDAVHLQRPGMPVVEHFGGFHNLVKQIEQALGERETNG